MVIVIAFVGSFRIHLRSCHFSCNGVSNYSSAWWIWFCHTLWPPVCS